MLSLNKVAFLHYEHFAIQYAKYITIKPSVQLSPEMFWLSMPLYKKNKKNNWYYKSQSPLYL